MDKFYRMLIYGMDTHPTFTQLLIKSIFNICSLLWYCLSLDDFSEWDVGWNKRSNSDEVASLDLNGHVLTSNLAPFLVVSSL